MLAYCWLGFGAEVSLPSTICRRHAVISSIMGEVSDRHRTLTVKASPTIFVEALSAGEQMSMSGMKPPCGYLSLTRASDT
jgi:hypothetical protein